jgi:uncharacterized membrane protein
MSKKHLREYNKWNVIFSMLTASLIFSLIGGLFNVTYGNQDSGAFLLGLSCLSCVCLFIAGIKRNGIRRRVKWTARHSKIVLEAKKIHESKSA